MQNLFSISANEYSSSSHTLARELPKRLGALAHHIINYWMTHGIDHEHGGFIGAIDLYGRPMKNDEKGAIQQARHLFALSAWCERREHTPLHEEAAHSTYQLLINAFRDDKDAEFYFTVSPQGRVLESKKMLYAQAFVIYGLSTYGSVFNHSQALDYALACFFAMDARAHDSKFGGYDEKDEPEWLTNGGRKGTNTHIHIMEAFAALYRATHDPTVKERLEELVAMVGSRAFQPQGYVHTHFTLDWLPLGDPVVSYGHDIETAWLLLDAKAALGKRMVQVEKAALRMGANAAGHGYDPKAGGFFDTGIPSQEVTCKDKAWWSQFEALAGLWWMFRLTGNDTYLEKLHGTLDWIEGPARDAEHGEFYCTITPDGTPAKYRCNIKGDIWKTMYHNLRAVLFTEDWVAEWLQKTPPLLSD